jgi:cell division protein FtsB
MRLLLVLLVVALVGLQYAYWWGKGGRIELRQLEREIAVQREELRQLQERNATLTAEVEDLQQGLDAIEELARSEMGMTKGDEEFLQVVEPQNAATRPRENSP